MRWRLGTGFVFFYFWGGGGGAVGISRAERSTSLSGNGFNVLCRRWFGFAGGKNTFGFFLVLVQTPR